MQPGSGQVYNPWQNWTALSQHLSRLQQTLVRQQEELVRLSRQVDELNTRVQAAEAKPMYHIDSLEYHFDQLKVEKLDGTLNIGMTPPGEEQLKEIGQLVMPGPGQAQPHGPGAASAGAGIQQTPFDLPGGEPQTSGPNTFPFSGAPAAPGMAPGPPYPEIRKEIDGYLDSAAYDRLAELEAEYGFQLDPFHRRLVVEDIRKQMSQRIQYYMNQSSSHGKTLNNESNLKSDVYTKTIRDIEGAMRGYLSRLQSAPGPEGGMNG
ncbi:spore germination protein GerPC [Paenibacillus humicola]|uniref:spore germination protein GerPC n=1 Tax=Paenibacillus humicola TaxID=3110540 RepID=UPI00237AB378|nr:spore germination protein GerPC [Paenibacillus humicola]